jgi:competence protein ComEC
MSFAAVVALIAFYEVLTAHPGRGEASALPRWLLYVLELLATSLLAGAATDLFGAYQFHRIAVYGLVTNLIAIPVTGFWVMPWAVVAMTLMPFGLERWGAVPMAWGNDVIIRAAEIVAAWPGAQWRFAAYGPGALLLMTAGALWLALWRRPWRYWGLMPLFLGLGLAAMPRPPDILIGTDGKMIALRDAKGQLAFNVARRGIARDDWLERAGETEPRRWREMPAEGERSLSCDEGGCVYHVKGYQVSFPETLRALGEDCRYADFIVAAFPLPRDCRPMLGQIDLFDLRREGPMTVRFSDGAEIETVRRIEGERPWSQWVP